MLQWSSALLSTTTLVTMPLHADMPNLHVCVLIFISDQHIQDMCKKNSEQQDANVCTDFSLCRTLKGIGYIYSVKLFCNEIFSVKQSAMIQDNSSNVKLF